MSGSVRKGLEDTETTFSLEVKGGRKLKKDGR